MPTDKSAPVELGTLPPVDPHTGLVRREFIAKAAGGIVSVGSLGGLLAACGGDTATTSNVGTPPTKPTGSVTAAIAATVETLDPARRNSAGFFPTNNMYDALIAWKDDFSGVEGQLVERWTVSSDLREWTGHVRPGVTFHDGAPLDSTAIRKNFEYFLKNPSTLFIPLPIKRIDDSEPTVVRFVFNEPYVDFTRNLTMQGIQSPKAIAAGNKAIERNPAGSGPFEFVSRSASLVKLKAYDGYWDKGKPRLAELNYQVIEDPGARIAALQAGQVDVVPNVLPSQVATINGDSRTQVVSSPSWLVTFLNFKLSVKPADDVRVRKAIAYAIDRSAILESVGSGLGKEPDSFEVPGLVGYQPLDPPITYDPERARALLSEVGGKVTIRIAIQAGDANASFLAGEASAQAIASMLKDVGIDAAVDSLQAGPWNGAQWGPGTRQAAVLANFPWFTGGPIMYDIIRRVWVLEQADPATWRRYDELRTRMGSMPDGAEREAVIGEVQGLFADRMFGIPLFRMPVLDAVSSRLQGYAPDKRNFGPRFDNAYLT